MRVREGLEPVCPFCRKNLAKPETITISPIEQALGGTCGYCGAVYIVDQTGKNLGEVMVQSLSIIAESILKEPSDLVLGEDYDDIILDYDWRTHRSSGEARGPRSTHGRLYVAKLRGDRGSAEAR